VVANNATAADYYIKMGANPNYMDGTKTTLLIHGNYLNLTKNYF
jgi:hypothetical protein